MRKKLESPPPPPPLAWDSLFPSPPPPLFCVRSEVKAFFYACLVGILLQRPVIVCLEGDLFVIACFVHVYLIQKSSVLCFNELLSQKVIFTRITL